jgi:hypothetical protein
MSLCERSARSGFQILLEPSGVELVRELNHHVSSPRSVLRRMGAVPLVVPNQPLLHVARNPDVITWSCCLRFEHVDESFRHYRSYEGKFIASGSAADFERSGPAEREARNLCQGTTCIWIAESAGVRLRGFRRFGATAFAWLAEPKLTAFADCIFWESAFAATRLRRDSPRSACRAEARRSRAKAGGPPGDRTRDTLIKSQVLYH